MLASDIYRMVSKANGTVAENLLRWDKENIPHTIKSVTHPGGAQGFRYTATLEVDGRKVEVQVKTVN